MKRALYPSALLTALLASPGVLAQPAAAEPAPGAAQPTPPAAGETKPAQPSQPGATAPAPAQPPAGGEGQPAAPPAEGAQPPTGEAPATPPAAPPTAAAAAQPPAAEAAAPAEAPPPPACPECPRCPECKTEKAGETQGLRTEAQEDRDTSLGLSPGAPQVTALPGGVTPAFGAASTRAQDWRFDFHGFVMLPLRLGINKRDNAGDGQKVTVLHAPPMTTSDYEGFDYLGIVPDPWVQLNFSYGNRDVTATVIVAARTVSNAAGYFNPPDNVGINDAFLTFHPVSESNVKFNFDVGAFANRYGHMGEYDMGRYGTPIIGRVAGMGFNETTTFDFEPVELVLEAGFMGQVNKAPVGVEPAGWNGFADPNVGTSWAPHGHVGIGYLGMAQLGLHVIHAFVQDDRATPAGQPDGSITVAGADLRLTLGRFGHLYTGFSRTNAEDARSVSGVLRILNAPGGPGLMENYFGPNSGGNGTLTTVGAQYDFSLGNFLRHPMKFEGNGPDVLASLFTIYTKVGSDEELYDGIAKLKYGTELTYSMLSWLALSGRYDRVLRDMGEPTQTTAVISPRLIFRSDFNSQDQVVLQYSRWLNGSDTAVKYGYPPVRDPSIDPDEHTLSLTASMWW